MQEQVIVVNELLNDELNIELLKLVCAGEGVDVNISELARYLGRHRNTIQSRFDNLLQHDIVDYPFFPFPWLLSELPLLVIELISLPRDSRTNLWIELDPNIWAAFFFKEREYNTLLVELHKSLYDYQIWKERALAEDILTKNTITEYIPSEPLYLSTRAILKHNPSSPVEVFRRNFKQGYHPKIRGLELDDLTIDILEALLVGKGTHPNPNSLAKSLNIHRKTVQRRLDLLLASNIIQPPVSRFPRIWAPPGYFLVLSLLEVSKNRQRISRVLSEDPHVSMLLRANAGRYNFLTFNSFYRMEDHLAWEEEYDQRFAGSIGAVRNFYLSPDMTFAIHQQYVSLAYLDARTEHLRGKEFMKSIQG